MIEIILLITGIVYAVRRPGLKNLASRDFPGVDSEKFAAWQAAELKGVDIFLWATWGAFVIKIGIQLFLVFVLSRFGIEISENVTIGIIFAILTVWLLGLVVAGVYGSKAKSLRLAAGIQWPIKGRTNIAHSKSTDGNAKHSFNSLATAGLVCAILGLIPLVGIGIIFASIGFILSFIAFGIIKRSKELIPGKGASIAGIMVGGVGFIFQIILITSIFFRFTNTIGQAKTAATLGSMNGIGTAIKIYELDNGEYPHELQMLTVDTKWQKAYFKEVPKDAWGRNFIYRVKSSKDFELFSSGSDGIEGTKDDVRLDGH